MDEDFSLIRTIVNSLLSRGRINFPHWIFSRVEQILDIKASKNGIGIRLLGHRNFD